MRSPWRSLLVLMCACKAEIGGISASNLPDDSTIDAGTLAPWSSPMLVDTANTASNEDDGSLSASKLELVFAKADAAIDSGRKHLYYTSRSSVTATTWTAPVRLDFNVNGTSDETPRFAAGDKTLYFASSRTGTTGGLDIWQTTRPMVGVATGWTTPTLVANVNSTETDKWWLPCTGGRYLMVSARAPSTNDDIYEGTVGGGAPTRVAELSSSDAGDTGPFLGADCLTVYFASTRSGANRIYKSTRTSVSTPWSAPTLVTDFMNVGVAQEDPWLSDDQRTFVFSATTTTNKDVYITTR